VQEGDIGRAGTCTAEGRRSTGTGPGALAPRQAPLSCVRSVFAYGNCWPAERGIYITAPSAGVTATALAAGGTHTCAIVTGGGVKCWGSNNQGQLGAGNTVEQPGMVVDVGFGTGALSSPPSSPGTVEHPILMVTVVSLGPGTAVQWAR
jgi:hypothetical protein